MAISGSKIMGAFIAIFFLAIFVSTPAQSIPSGREGGSEGNVLFGDFKVSGSPGMAKKPEIFHLILYFTNGTVLSRTTTSNPGRYRFLNVPNGIYDLVVEAENQELARMRLTIQEVKKSDVQRDLNLEWGGASDGIGTQPRATRVEEYSRSAANQVKYEKALADSRNKNNDSATDLLKQIVSEDAKDYVAWTELGTVQFRQEKMAEAEKSYLKALDVKPMYIVALMNLGKLQMVQKNFDSAVETFTKAVTVQPNSADANHFLGESYLQIKKGSKAVGYLNQALKLDPLGKAEIHLRLATLYHGAGLKEKAAAEYELFLSKKPDYSDKKKLEEYIKTNKKI